MPDQSASLQITGSVTTATPEVFKSWLDKLPVADSIDIDLGGIEELDSACVALLVKLARRCQVNDRKVTFSNPPAKLLSLVELYGVQELLGIEHEAS